MVRFMNYSSPARGIVPIVLHRIVRDTPSVWEDVHEDRLKEIISHITGCWTVFEKDCVINDARWMLTFDDGNLSDYEIAFPLLLDAGVSAVFFLITERVGQPGYLSWAQIEEMHKNGMCIGSHSSSHRSLTALEDKQATFEFERSKWIIEQRIGAPVTSFSYPFGACDARLHALGLAAGYSYLCSSFHGVFSGRKGVVPRNSVHSRMDSRTIARLMEPTMITRFRWGVEDVTKRALRDLIGPHRYARFRNKLFL